MTLTTLDWSIILGFFVISLGIGVYVSRRAGKSASEFFLSGQQMPWWLLGISMVATTFSTDTPNLVTDIVRQKGVAGNWVWWAFLLTGMLTVFVYARLWRKSGLTTDLAFYELRYGGEGAKFLRVFRALYLGVAFNLLAMSGVALAAIKIGEVMLGWPPLQTIGITSAITVVFSFLGGFRGVVLTDFLLFFISMIGAVSAAYIAIQVVPVDGLSGLLAHPNVSDKLDFVPDFDDPALFLSIFLIPLVVQWWSSWYPGAEPGGGGYIAQRMLAAKDEKNAVAATLFFNVAHYALRPWPWIIVALASLVMFPDLESLGAAFPDVSESKLGHDLAYPAMLTFLPSGLMGLVLTSLAAAYMSTISTHLNWGSSYFVYDVYKRVINTEASEKEMVLVGRLSTIVMMLLAVGFAMILTNAKQLFDIIIMFGAGTGLIFILRWFWWRINIWGEIAAMFVSGIVALSMKFTSLFNWVEPDYQFPLSVLITTVVWLAVNLMTPPEDDKVLMDFVRKINPGGPGWKRFTNRLNDEEQKNKDWQVPYGILAMIGGCMVVYSLLFMTGSIIYGQFSMLIFYLIALIIGIFVLLKTWEKLDI
jgi:Na+/proline symporter